MIGPLPGETLLDEGQFTLALMQARLDLAADDIVHQGVMVALYPTKEQADELAIGAGEDACELHVTLAYLGKTPQVDRDILVRAVDTWAKETPIMNGVISGVGKFTEGPDPVTYWSVDVPQLANWRELLVRTLKHFDLPVKEDHGFTPHMTIAYQSRRPEPPKGFKLRFGGCCVAYGDEKIEIPFGASGVL